MGHYASFKFQVAASTTNPPTSYVGPDGTANTWFTLPRGLWHLNEAASGAVPTTAGYVTDASGNGKNGTYTGTPGAVYVTGRLTGAIQFDGTDDYVTVGNLGAGVRTVEFWISDANATDGIMELNSTTAYISKASGSISATGFGTPIYYVDGAVSSSLPASGWHHVVVVASADVFASAGIFGRAGADYMAGILDEVVFHDRPPTQDQSTAPHKH